MRRTLDVVGIQTVSLVTLVSFDIDGTLEVGEPPGIVPVTLVRTAKRLGYLVGSCSDRPISYQRELWERLHTGGHFTVLKHRLSDATGRLSAGADEHTRATRMVPLPTTAPRLRALSAAARSPPSV